MKKADIVFAVVLDFDRRAILLLRCFGGFWSFPGGEVRSDETEQDATLRHAMETLMFVSVTVVEQLGPMYTLPDGRTAKAFVCQIDGRPVPSEESTFSECDWFDASMLDTDIDHFECPEIGRMAWDGITIMIPPGRGKKQVDLLVEGYFCDPGKPHILVHEGESERHEWLRLDPGVGGCMKPE